MGFGSGHNIIGTTDNRYVYTHTQKKPKSDNLLCNRTREKSKFWQADAFLIGLRRHHHHLQHEKLLKLLFALIWPLHGTHKYHPPDTIICEWPCRFSEIVSSLSDSLKTKFVSNMTAYSKMDSGHEIQTIYFKIFNFLANMRNKWFFLHSENTGYIVQIYTSK